jgi:hypothetical protein
MAMARTKQARKPLASARRRYEKLVNSLGEFAATRVDVLERKMATIDLSARKNAVRYIRSAIKELRLLEKELKRIEKTLAPEDVVSRTPRPAAKRPSPERRKSGERKEAL